MSLIGRLGSRMRREAGIGIARTLLYKRTSIPIPTVDVCADSDVRIARIAAPEIGSIGALGSSEPDEWQQRLERGDCCYGAWIGDVLAHYSWVQTTGMHSIAAAGIVVPIVRGDFWIYNCRTADEHRGKRIYARTLERIASDFFAEGARLGWIYTASDNVSSQRGIIRAGFLTDRTLRALQFGRRFRALGEDAAPIVLPRHTGTRSF